LKRAEASRKMHQMERPLHAAIRLSVDLWTVTLVKA
jgi:hypothetical protein